MRSALIVLLFLIHAGKIHCQCPPLQLADLQMLQRGNDAQRENSLRSLGFDLTAKVGNARRYDKCWNTNRKGKAIFDQILFWHENSRNFTFLTPDEEAFLEFRKSIEGRHGQTGTLGTSDRYIGQVFQYKFGSRWLDGVMHWSVDISFK